LILNRKACFVFIDVRVIRFSLPEKIRISLPMRTFLLFLRNHWQDNFQNLLNCIKPQSSLPQVGCARVANTFPNHNQSLTHEFMTRPVHPGFLVTLNQILGGDSQTSTNKQKTPLTPRGDVRQG
jgi:hypothetical protein